MDANDGYELRFLEESLDNSNSGEEHEPIHDPDLLTPVPDTDQNVSRQIVRDSWHWFLKRGDLYPMVLGPARRSFFWRKIGELPIEKRPKSLTVHIDTKHNVTNMKQAQFVPDMIQQCRATSVVVGADGWFDDAKFVDGMKSVTFLQDLTVRKDATDFVDFSAWLGLLNATSLKRVCFGGPGEGDSMGGGISNQNGVYQAPMPSFEHQVHNALTGHASGNPFVLEYFSVEDLYIHDLASLARALSPCKSLKSARAEEVLGPGVSSSAEFGTTLLNNHPLLEEIYVESDSAEADGLTIHNGWNEFTVALSEHPRIKSISFSPFPEESCIPDILRVCSTKMLPDELCLGRLVRLKKKDEHYELEIHHFECDEAAVDEVLQTVASFNTELKISIDLEWISPSVPAIESVFSSHSSCMVTKLSLGVYNSNRCHHIDSEDLDCWAEGLMDYEKLTELRLVVKDDAMVTAFCPRSSLEHLDIAVHCGRSAAAEKDCPLALMMLFEHPTLQRFWLRGAAYFGSQVARAVRVHPNLHALSVSGVSSDEQNNRFFKLLLDNVLGYNQHLVELEVWGHHLHTFSFFVSNLHRVKFLDKLDIFFFQGRDLSMRAQEEKWIIGLRNNYSITSVSCPSDYNFTQVPKLLSRNKLLSVKKNVPFSLWPRGIIKMNSAEGDDATCLFTLLQQSEHVFWHAFQRRNQKRNLPSDSA